MLEWAELALYWKVGAVVGILLGTVVVVCVKCASHPCSSFAQGVCVGFKAYFISSFKNKCIFNDILIYYNYYYIFNKLLILFAPLLPLCVHCLLPETASTSLLISIDAPSSKWPLSALSSRSDARTAASSGIESAGYTASNMKRGGLSFSAPSIKSTLHTHTHSRALTHTCKRTPWPCEL